MRLPAEKTRMVDGVSIRYLDKNEQADKTILCLHALGHSFADYKKLFDNADFGSIQKSVDLIRKVIL